jgi:hypothetical protein
MLQIVLITTAYSLLNTLREGFCLFVRCIFANNHLIQLPLFLVKGPMKCFSLSDQYIYRCNKWCNWAPRHEAMWGSRGIALAVLTSAVDRLEWASSRPCFLNPGGEATDIHRTWGWLVHKSSLDLMEKIEIFLSLGDQYAISSPVAKVLHKLRYNPSLTRS